MISIVVPAHNEEKNLPVLIKELNKVLSKNKIKAEIILVNDRSTDNTGSVARKLARRQGNIKVIHRKQKGPFRAEVGLAIRDGIKKAKGNLVITMDADLSHQPKDIPHFIEASKEYDVVIGSRYMKGGRMRSTRGRIMISKGFSLVSRILYGLKIHDITSGYRIHKRKVLKKLKLKSWGFEIHAEIPLRARMLGFKVGEIPITYAKRLAGRSKLKYAKMGPRYLGVMLKTRFRKN